MYVYRPKYETGKLEFGILAVFDFEWAQNDLGKIILGSGKQKLGIEKGHSQHREKTSLRLLGKTSKNFI